jgi:Tfp pilus assembly protein PilO
MMLTLQRQIQFCARAQWTLGGAIVVLLGGTYLLGYRPASRELGLLDADIGARQRELAGGSDKTKVLPQLSAEVKTLKARLQGAKTLPNRSDIAQFLKDIAQLSQQSSLKLDYKQVDSTMRGELFSQQQVKLRFEGNFASVFSFLRQTEAMQRLTRTRSINIQRNQGASGTVSVEMAMNMYFTPEE